MTAEKTMKTMNRTNEILLALGLLLLPSFAHAGAIGGWGRVSLFGTWLRSSTPGQPSTTFSELMGTATVRSKPADEGGYEYAVDLRGSTYPSSEERKSRFSIYDAYAGARTTGGVFGVKLGQMWINDLGGLGSFAGVLAEVRQPKPSPAGRLRFGVFAGLEPEILDVGYASGVRKGGVYLALDGASIRKHVLGYVLVRNSGKTERSVLTLTNFIPSGRKFFLYQAAEYDVAKPGGLGKSGLNYIFANARYAPIPLVEVQGTYHHGRSIDARTITLDQLNGRPVDARKIEGFLFETIGGRVTFTLLPTLRVYGGYSRDRHNQDEGTSGRTTVGLFASNVAGSGFDVSVSDNRTHRKSSSYDAWYASLGRSLGQKFYFSADYSSSLSILRWVGSNGVTVETRPRMKRYSLYGMWNVSRSFSFMITGERIKEDETTQNRILTGLMYRF
jgi:hypothetical protein